MTPQQTAQSVLNSCWDRSIPVRLPRLAELMGARVVIRGGSFDAGFDCKGRVAWHGMAPLIEVNAYENSIGRRVVIAHQLGHFALRHRDSVPDTVASFAADATDPRDRDANIFASVVLMPEDAVRQAHAQGRTPNQLADAFEVPLSAMTARLQELGLLA